MTSADRPRRWAIPILHRPFHRSDLTAVLLLIVAAVLVLELLPADYYMLLPGEARPVSAMLSVAGYPPVHSKGVLYMTDVSIYKVDHKLEEIYGRLNADADLESTKAVSGTLSQSQYQQYNAQLMTGSIEAAEVAALTLTHRFRLTCVNTKPQIQTILPGTPASKVLVVGDLIEAINGRTICSSRQVFPLVRQLRPGNILRLVILHNGKRTSRNVRAIAAIRTSQGLTPSPRGNLTMIGVSMQDILVPHAVHLPVNIRINPGNTVGPSAGLMYTLAIIERLQQRDIAHGCKVAGTGTVDYAGNVGPIGGAKQKVIAARNAGAQYFLVPSETDNVGPARAHRGNVTVIPVNSVQQALQTLDRLRPCK